MGSRQSSGCNLVLPLGPAAADRALDSAPADAGSADQPSAADLGQPGPDSTDLLQPDASPGGLCPTDDPSVVAAYILDPQETSQLAPTPAGKGLPVGQVLGSASVGPGPAACPATAAVTFPGAYMSFAAIPSHGAWQLARGSVEFLLRLAPTTDTLNDIEGILSRDAFQTAKPGHLAVLRAHDHVVARLQSVGGTGYACSAVLAEGEWYRVRVSFGPPAGLVLQVWDSSGSPVASHTQPIQLYQDSDDAICADPGAPDWGIAGNDNIWVLGGLGWSLPEGTTVGDMKPSESFTGQIGALRIRAQ